MRMEELSESRYIKNTDSVEKYLLNLVEQYFKNQNIASTTSREYIIKKAVERMKEEISFDSIGVLSIILPSGEVRTGAVTITLEDLNGEPLISPKQSAFNVSFGVDQNTACEGNDPRLSDARTPVEHKHNVSDIIGLEGILSTITGKVERVNGFVHKHNNKPILDMLVYTGSKSIIDLTLIDTLENKISKIVEDIRADIQKYKQEINTKVTEINTKIASVKVEIEDLKKYILSTNKEYLEQANDYTDTEIVKANTELKKLIDKLVTKEKLKDVTDIASNTYTLVGSMSFSIASVIDLTSEAKQQEKIIDIAPAIITELTTRGVVLADCQIESLIEYDIGNKVFYCVLPYITFNKDDVDGAIQISTINAEKKIKFNINTAAGIIPPEIQSAKIIYNVYSKQPVTI